MYWTSTNEDETYDITYAHTNYGYKPIPPEPEEEPPEWIPTKRFIPHGPRNYSAFYYEHTHRENPILNWIGRVQQGGQR